MIHSAVETATSDASTWIGVWSAIGIGLGSLAVGTIGLVKAHQAKGAADEANRIAVRANDIAGEANDIAKRGELRQSEKHDVDWDCGWRKPGIYVLTNAGRDVALNVRIRITVAGVTEAADVKRVEPAGEVILEIPNALALWRTDEAERETFERGRKAQSGVYGSFIVPPMSLGHAIRDYVMWTTELDTPKYHDESYRSSLEP